MTEHADGVIDDQALTWFTRQLDAPLPPPEQQAFEAWLAASPLHAQAWQRVSSLWSAPLFEQALQDIEQALPPVATPLATRTRRQRWLPFASAAAVLLVLGGWLADLPMRWEADYLTAVGEQQRFTLADGSQVLLDGNSAISVRIDAGQRSLKLLRGDIYVDAFHDTGRPLRIRAADTRVEVVGTRFSVGLRDEDVTVAVDEGKVRVNAVDGGSVLLGAGAWQRLMHSQSGENHEQGSAEQHGWTQGRLIFQDRPLREVLDELERRQRAPILVFGDAGQRRVSGNYLLADPEAVVNALTRISGAQMTRLPGGVLLVR